MLELTKGNILEADTEALVNTVNTEGVMYEAYRRACEAAPSRVVRG